LILEGAGGYNAFRTLSFNRKTRAVMASYKDPGFQERTALAKAAKLKALQQLKAKPPVDPAVLAERAAAAAAKEAAAAAARAEKIAAREAEKAAKKAEAEAKAAFEAAQPALTAAQQKAARDARYAARKNRK
jgi:hypothetical protein